MVRVDPYHGVALLRVLVVGRGGYGSPTLGHGHRKLDAKDGALVSYRSHLRRSALARGESSQLRTPSQHGWLSRYALIGSIFFD